MDHKITGKELREALDRDEIKVFLQFLVDAKDERIRGAELLSRWSHPIYGNLRPDNYIRQLEAEGSIIDLDMFSLESACAVLERWEKKGWKEVKVSCNFSRGDFQNPFLFEKIKDIIEHYDFRRDNLILELTENAVNSTPYYIERGLLKLREYGICVALDDLGAGDSSLRDLQLFPLDYIKLDKSLLDYSGSPAGNQVLQDVTRLGRNLNCIVILEGVETRHELCMAREAGVDLVQGFHFYMPMPLQKAEETLDEYFRSGAKA